MKIIVNGIEQDATPEQEAEILAFQNQSNQNINDYTLQLQLAIDTKASERGYSSGVLCSSYIQSTNAQWAAEAQSFIAWRDTCFEYGYHYLAQVQDGTITSPNIDEFISGLPVMEWPTVNP